MRKNTECRLKPLSHVHPGRNAKLIVLALRAELGATLHAVKPLMKLTITNEEAMRNWLTGASDPRVSILLP